MSQSRPDENEMAKIRMFMTMDCEPSKATHDKAGTGPDDWDHGERAVRGFVAIAKEFHFPVTLFIHPETAVAQAPLFKELEADGVTLGLHMHPWKYSLHKYQGQKYCTHYGGLNEQEQRELLAEAIEDWANAIGHHPLWFRPGTFSANDAIFRVLASLGFKGGSCSAPGRVMPAMFAVWSGAKFDPHWANTDFRQVDGDLNFVEVPQSMDTSQLLEARKGFLTHASLCPDVDFPGKYGVEWSTIARNQVAQLIERNPALPVMSVVTHNHYEFQDPGAAETRRLREMLQEAKKACNDKGIELVGRTLVGIAEEHRALPRGPTTLVIEGKIYEKAGKAATLKET